MRLILLSLIVLGATLVECGNKYSKESNTIALDKDGEIDKNPFRMGKLNLLWEKAQKRMSKNKLLALFSELKLQDKEEMTFKKLKMEGGDKGGLKEAEIRKKLGGIMNKYSLSDDLRENRPESSKEAYMNEVVDRNILKAVFKDKKLNKLWAKAESSGFTEVELKALKEEFEHHQDKVDEYYALVQTASTKLEGEQNNLENDMDRFNTLQDMEITDKSSSDPTNTIREKHRELKTGYDRLHKVASTGPESKEFLEPKVAGLWKLAVRADFTQEELESLHTELKHYEHRLLKVRHMTGQINLLEDKAREDTEKLQGSEGHRIMQERLTKQQRKIERLHEDLEQRIIQRHHEL